MNTVFFVFLSTLLLGVNCVIVKLKDGYIDGTTARTKEGRLFHKFLGIPYAKPPVGSLRFQNPEPVEPWEGIKDTTEPPSVCLQRGPPVLAPGYTIEKEDCLYLNVYIPHALLNASGKAPVLVYIHGGSFQTGSANDYTSDYFMERDIITVTMNYRLGLLGFLAVNQLPFTLPDNNKISGNFGLKDQTLALRWVKENIAAFGGDPGNVTIMGESAGAASVHFHMYSPLSKGLFQKAIFQGGSAFSPWSHFPSRFKVKIKATAGIPLNLRLDQMVALAFLNKTKCTGVIVSKILKCLQDIPEEDFTKPDGLKDSLLYLPTIELGVKEGIAFLPHEPNATNYVTKVPWLTGMNSADGAMISPYLLMDGAFLCKVINWKPEIFIPLINVYIVSTNQSVMQNVTDAVKKFYFHDERVGLETAQNLTSMITDSSWLVPLMKTVSSGPDVQYLYLYDHRGTFSLNDRQRITADLGVAHADELPLLFRVKEFEAMRSIEDRRVSDTLLKYWINFAISQDPNKHSIDKLWQPMQSKNESFEYLRIKSNGVNMEKDLYKARYDLWKSLPVDSL